ncbi:class I SAM-dependent methyltransferase [Halostagnicola bangensis]
MRLRLESHHTPMATEEISHPLFATLYDGLSPMEWLLAPHRRYLATDLAGRVLDVGAGAGAMFSHVVDEREDDPEQPLEYHAVEPDPHMRKRASRSATEAGLEVVLRDERAESLPYPDDSFDVVLSGLVFCTIQDPDAALEEVARVLEPGGEFRFLEHVHADGWQGAGQNLLNPLWERLAGGCQLNRETVERFVCRDEFSVRELERLEFGVFPVNPVVRGTLYRTQERWLPG